jgi:hypothetical protein
MQEDTETQFISQSQSQSQSQYRCIICNKEYTKKSSLDKHKILCDFKLKTKREKKIETEELGDVPNHLELVKIVQELTLKMIKMEEKMEEMQKWVIKKKKKINVISWLNTNISPSIGFLEWVHTSIIVNSEHFESLMENTIFYTFQQIIEHNLCKRDDFVHPICCFSQKPGIFYICEKNADEVYEWKEMESADIILLFKKIHTNIIKELTNWKSANQYQFDDNDKISILFNKAVIKVMNISVTNPSDSSFTKIKHGLFNYLKSDLKMVLDIEFE